VEIGTLRLRGPPEMASLAAFHVEDACRTEIAESERLVLVRRLRLGRAVSGSRPRERGAAVGSAWAHALAQARHGRNAGDGADLNCVWFESPAEARRLLLAELLAGRRPRAWFWRIAVPDWSELGLEEWLGEAVDRVLDPGGDADALDLLFAALERGAAEALVRAIESRAGGCASPVAEAPRGRGRRERSTATEAPQPAGEPPHLLSKVERLRLRVAPPLLEAVEALVRRLGAGRAICAPLLERLLLRASPALALSPAELKALVGAHAARLDSPPGYSAPAPIPPAVSAGTAPPPDASGGEAAEAETPAPPAGGARGSQAPPDRADAPPPAEEAHDSRADEDETARAPKAEAGEAGARATSLLPCRGDESEAAGLWLVVPTLIRLGWREWLAERPRLLGEDPGRRLLLAIARHHRVPERDPAILPLLSDPEEPEPAPEWARLWRIAADRWLRRRARVPLARLVWRPGVLACAEDRLTIRFPAEDADIRLRRLALDVDPGWTDWLGLSVRYVYEERRG
jgi:hypothetical protein